MKKGAVISASGSMRWARDNDASVKVHLPGDVRYLWSQHGLRWGQGTNKLLNVPRPTKLQRTLPLVVFSAITLKYYSGLSWPFLVTSTSGQGWPHHTAIRSTYMYYGVALARFVLQLSDDHGVSAYKRYELTTARVKSRDNCLFREWQWSQRQLPITTCRIRIHLSLSYSSFSNKC